MNAQGAEAEFRRALEIDPNYLAAYSALGALFVNTNQQQRAIEEYRRELVPLIVPITLLRHHVRSHGVSYLAGQLYLEPHPKELMLRNHV